MAFSAYRYRSAAPAPGQGRSTAHVFAIGRRVFVASPTAQTPPVTLTNDSGTTTCGKLRDGTEVEIVAWIPRGPQGTRYLVRSSSKGIEGWLGAGDLRGSKAKAAKVATVAVTPSRKSAR